MDSEPKILVEPLTVPHPGEMVLDYLEFHGWTQSDLARRTGLTPKTISEICNGKAAITPPTSLAFEKVFQRPAHLWLNLQRQFDESVARRQELSRSAAWATWAARFPVKEMKKLRFLADTSQQRQFDVDTLLSFLGVSSPDSWASVWQATHVAYRQTRKGMPSPEAISVWVRETELSAEKLSVADFDEQRLRSRIDDLRRLTRLPADRIMEPVQTLCGEAGVAVVWVPELKNTGISGCARWLTDKKALIGMTLRYKTDDQMWFTFFHELAHILLHRTRRSFVLDNAAESVLDRIVDPEMQRYEEEANRFSSDTLIPPEALAAFVRQHTPGNDAIHKFAEELGVGPGVVVGRLQHDGFLEPHQGNALKQKLQWNFSE